MAGEIFLSHNKSGRTLYAHVLNKTSQIYRTDTQVFEAYSTANIANYDIAMTEQGTASRYYLGAFPTAGVSAGRYRVVIHEQSGGSPGEADDVVGFGDYEWNGSALYASLQPTVEGRTLDVSAGGEAGLDWGNIGSPTTTQGLSGTTIKTATDVETDTQDIQSRLPAALVSGRMDSSVGAMAAGVVTAAAIATDAIDADALAASAITEIQSGLATSADVTTILSRLPAALVSGRMDSHVGSMASDVITASALAASAVDEIVDAVWDELKSGHTVPDSFGDYLDDEITSRAAPGDAMDLVAGAVDAAAIATDAIDGDAIAASAVTEIQAGLATAAAVAAVQADTDDIQTRLPATLSGGKMRSQVEGMDAGTITAAAVATDAIDGDAIAASAVTEIQSGLATAAAVAAVQADTDDIQTRLPAALVGGKMDSTLSSAERDAIASALLDLASAVESLTVRNTLKFMAAVLCGKATGGPGNSVFQSIGGSSARVASTADSNGDRSAVTLTP